MITKLLDSMEENFVVTFFICIILFFTGAVIFKIYYDNIDSKLAIEMAKHGCSQQVYYNNGYAKTLWVCPSKTDVKP